MGPVNEEFWYRYEVRNYAPPVDEFDNICGSGRSELVCEKLRVLRHTPKGVRLAGGRFVLRGARKRFAAPTKEEARQSLIARKRRQIKILQAQLRHAELCLAMAEGRSESRVELIDLAEFV